MHHLHIFSFFFFNDTATTEIYTLSLHDALPILRAFSSWVILIFSWLRCRLTPARDRKSTRLNSSHGYISYAVFCLKKKKKRIVVKRHVRQSQQRVDTSSQSVDRVWCSSGGVATD